VLLGESPPPQVVGELAELAAGDVRLDALTSATPTRSPLDLQVTAQTLPPTIGFFEGLVESPRFVDLRPGSESRRGELRCTLRATYRGVSR